MIALEKVSAGIGRVQILREVDLAVAPGQLVLVLGANGAGKTTLLRVISGVVPLWSGNMRLVPSRLPAGRRTSWLGWAWCTFRRAGKSFRPCRLRKT